MQIQTTVTNSLLTGLTGYFQFGAILDNTIVNVFSFLFFPYNILFLLQFPDLLQRNPWNGFWVKDTNFDMVLTVYPSISLGVQQGLEKDVTLHLLFSWELEAISCSCPFERGTFILSLSLLSELSWPFLLILMAHYSHLSSISVVLENCKAHFHVGCLSLEPLKKKSNVLLMVGAVCSAVLSLFGSVGHVPSLRGILPELLRSFQAGERSRLWCALTDLISHADAVA